jgi:hypothetical protein
MRLLQGEFHDGDKVVVDASDGALQFRKGEVRSTAGAARNQESGVGTR